MRAVLNVALLSCVLAGLLAAGIPKTAGDVKTRAAKLDPALRTRALERARELPRLRSLLVSIDGELVEERYFNGARATDPANLKSASKSVLR